MVDVLIKAFSFILVIIIGYQLKWRGVLQPETGTALSKLMMNFTLPAAVITGFASFLVDHSLLILVAFGLGCNLLSVGYWLYDWPPSPGRTESVLHDQLARL
ncbi:MULTISPECIES: hypothetical protein [Symbiopectobacterium]|uniref:hypothetical protein n=1 Tax=Symbiopectobacterium TaxID=801 RepID=UPI002079E145|nr:MULTISPECIES: hypothetical protein [Symbiopectobacterium]